MERDEHSLVLVFGADERFSLPLAVTLYSALANLQGRRRVSIYILDGGLSPESQSRLRQVAQRARVGIHLEFIRPDLDLIRGYSLKIKDHITEAAFLRLLIPELLPEQFERAIYLDSDMVVEADLGQLWDAELGQNAVLAVRDLYIPYLSSMLGLYNWRELGLAPDAPYFNSGLLVMNLRRWRAEDLGGRILRYLSEQGTRINHSDQEGLNAILAGMWGALDPRWNLTYAYFDQVRFEESEYKEEVRSMRKAFVREPYIIHYTHKKPWDPKCVHPARFRFFHYLKLCKWFTSAEYARWRLVRLPEQAVALLRQFSEVRTRPLRKLIGRGKHAVPLWARGM